MTLLQTIKQDVLPPSEQTEEPLVELMWDTSMSIIVNSHKVALHKTLLYMLGK